MNKINELSHSSIISFGNNRKNNVTNARQYVNLTRMQDDFCKMAKIDTGSNEALSKREIPSSDGQWTLARMLIEDLKALNLKDVNLDENCIVTATLPGNIDGLTNVPVVGLLAHMDTSPDVPTGPVTPVIHKYESGDLKLNDKISIPEKDLINHKGKTIITSDGRTLLGADDKAGIEEIKEALRIFAEHPEIKHPTIRIAFTPDEENLNGIRKLNLAKFGADLAYTLDINNPFEIDTASFNAFNPVITIKGNNVHPGKAYGVMVNSLSIARDFDNMLPNERPEHSKDKEGYYLVEELKGNVDSTSISMLVRDFDYQGALSRIKVIKEIIEKLKQKYPGSEITFEPNESYRNAMKEALKDIPEAIEYAKEGMKITGLDPKETAIRGGTDGSVLSASGLPTPNLGTGGGNFHSVREFVPLEDMAQSAANVVHLMQIWANNALEMKDKILALRENNN